MFAEARRLCAPTLKRGARLPIRAVSYEAAIDQLFKRMRSSSSALTPNKRSVLPGARYPTKDVAVDRHMADGRKRKSQNLSTKENSVSEWDSQFCLVRVHHEHREELGRLRLAGIGADVVALAGQLGEALSGLVGRHRSFVDLTADRPLKHGRIDKGVFGMRVTGRAAARGAGCRASFFHG